MMKKVFVFKTSICKRKEIKTVQPYLNKLIRKNGSWNFDLEDCDCILRVESHEVIPASICSIIEQQGFECVELN